MPATAADGWYRHHTARHKRNGHRRSGSSQQICMSGVRTGRHRQPAAQRQRTRHAYMIRHGVTCLRFTCHRRQHAATTARSMACMHAAAAARQVAAAEQCSVPVPAFHRIARAIGARLGAVVVDCWWCRGGGGGPSRPAVPDCPWSVRGYPDCSGPDRVGSLAPPTAAYMSP